MDLYGRTQVPLEEEQVQALLPVRKRLQLQTSQAVRRFLERLASLLLVRLLETQSRCHWACAQSGGNKAGALPTWTRPP